MSKQSQPGTTNRRKTEQELTREYLSEITNGTFLFRFTPVTIPIHMPTNMEPKAHHYRQSKATHVSIHYTYPTGITHPDTGLRQMEKAVFELPLDRGPGMAECMINQLGIVNSRLSLAEIALLCYNDAGRQRKAKDENGKVVIISHGLFNMIPFSQGELEHLDISAKAIRHAQRIAASKVMAEQYEVNQGARRASIGDDGLQLPIRQEVFEDDETPEIQAEPVFMPDVVEDDAVLG